jgi:S1-C subfamily serine protease
VELSVLRPKDESVDTLQILTTLEKAPIAPSDAPEYENKSLEFKVRNMVFSDYMYNQLDPDTFKGVVVSELKPGGLAAIGGLNLGDIIQRIDDHQITSVDDVRAAMEQLEQEQTREIIFFIWRDNKTLFVNVKTDWHQAN